MESIKAFLPEKYRNTADKLSDIRTNKAQDFNSEDSFQTIIKERVDGLIQKSAITVIDGNDRAFYISNGSDDIIDSIRIPKYEQFTNPLHFYSVVSHELAHSTMHINERDASISQNPKTKKTNYAYEECVAELTAMIMVSQLKDELVEKGLWDIRKDIRDAWEEHEANALHYVKGWGERLDKDDVQRLKDIFKVFEANFNVNQRDGKQNIAMKLAEDVSNAVYTLTSNDVVITPESRREALIANRARVLEKDKENTSEAP